MTKPIRSPRRCVFVGCFALAWSAFASGAPAAEPVPQTEISDVATLPPAGPHQFLMTDAVYLHAKDGRVYLVDADRARLLATVQASFYANAVADPRGRYYSVAETIWTRGNRGARQDLLSVYDPHTLALSAEIPLPGRALITTKRQDMDVGADGRLVYVYDLSPDNAVILVDVAARRVLGSVAVPGCGLAFAWGSHGFSSICADGSLSNVDVADPAHPAVTHTRPFFPPQTDPVFEQSPTDRATGHTWFISYTGLVYPITLGPNAAPEQPWSIDVAAGQPRAPGAEAPRAQAWRPGGWQIAAMHRADRHLYVLMHQGPFWTHKQSGTEVWELDAAAHRLIRRIKLAEPAQLVGVTQDAAPLLVTTTEEGEMTVLDAASGKKLRSIKHLGDQVLLAQAQGE